MKEAVGDLWTYGSDPYRVVPTNGVVMQGGGTRWLVMGAGVAADAVRRYPGVQYVLGEWVYRYGNRPYVLAEHRLISWPTKHHWKDRASMDLLMAAGRVIVDEVEARGIEEVVLPRVGCGLGGLSWPEVRDKLAALLSDRFTVVSPEEQ